MNNGYKEATKEMNLIMIIVCWVINLFCMFVYPALTIFIANLLVILILNIIIFIVWKVME